MTVGFMSLTDRLLSCAGAMRSVKSKAIMTRTINRVIFCLMRRVLFWLFDIFKIMGASRAMNILELYATIRLSLT